MAVYRIALDPVHTKRIMCASEMEYCVVVDRVCVCSVNTILTHISHDGIVETYGMLTAKSFFFPF